MAFAAVAFGVVLWRTIAAATAGEQLAPPTTDEAIRVTLAIVILASLALLLDQVGPIAIARGRRTIRRARAWFRSRFRHGRTRGDLANVELGSAMAAGAILVFGTCLVAMSWRGLEMIMVAAVGVALFAHVAGILAICQQAGFAPTWSAGGGFLFGLWVGYAFG